MPKTILQRRLGRFLIVVLAFGQLLTAPRRPSHHRRQPTHIQRWTRRAHQTTVPWNALAQTLALGSSVTVGPSRSTPSASIRTTRVLDVAILALN